MSAPLRTKWQQRSAGTLAVDVNRRSTYTVGPNPLTGSEPIIDLPCIWSRCHVWSAHGDPRAAFVPFRVTRMRHSTRPLLSFPAAVLAIILMGANSCGTTESNSTSSGQPTAAGRTSTTSTRSDAALASWSRIAVGANACSVHSFGTSANITFHGDTATDWCTAAKDALTLEDAPSVDSDATAVICTVQLYGAEAAVTDGGGHDVGRDLCSRLLTSGSFIAVTTPGPSAPSVAETSTQSTAASSNTGSTPVQNDPDAAAKSAGATAICADGTWSYSQNRSGTCSHHGGVHWWTGNLGPAGPGGH